MPAVHSYSHDPEGAFTLPGKHYIRIGPTTELMKHVHNTLHAIM